VSRPSEKETKMRYQILSLALATLLAGCASHPAPDGPQKPAAQAQVQTGEIVRFEPVDSLDRARLQAVAAELPGAIAVENGVSLYRLVYRSGVRGQPIEASALVAVPDTGAVPRGVVMYLRGSDLSRGGAPTMPGAIWTTEAAVYGGNGFITVIPDYIGFGAAPSPQAFLLTTDNVADFRAALSAVQSALDLRGETQLFVTGFSQGGQLSAALHRDLETRPQPGYALRATVSIAGPHELVQSFNIRTQAPRSRDPVAMGYVAWAAYTFAWYEGRPLEEVFVPEYVVRVPEWFSGEMPIAQVLGEAPEDVRDLLQPEFLDAMRTQENFWFNRMVRSGETYDWAPRAPLKVIVGTGDERVDPEATRILYDTAKARGGNVSIAVLPGLTHQQTGDAAFATALAWFETMAPGE
jgi:acetyl esterase/lipase